MGLTAWNRLIEELCSSPILAPINRTVASGGWITYLIHGVREGTRSQTLTWRSTGAPVEIPLLIREAPTPAQIPVQQAEIAQIHRLPSSSS